MIFTIYISHYPDIEWEFSNNQIKSFKLSNTITSDNSKPNFGIIGQYGSISIKLYDEQLQQLYNYKNKGGFNNWLVSFRAPFLEYESNLWIINDINNNNVDKNIIDITLKDWSELLKSIPHNQKNKYDYLNIEDIIWQLDEEIYPFLGWSDFSSDLKLNGKEDCNLEDIYGNGSIYMYDNYTNVYDYINAICQAFHLSCYMLRNGLRFVAYE